MSPDYPTENENIQASKSDSGVVTVTSINDSFSYLALILSSSDPDQLYVGYINGTNQTAILPPGGSADVNLVVLSWRNGESYLNAEVSLISRLETPASECPCVLPHSRYIFSGKNVCVSDLLQDLEMITFLRLTLQGRLIMTCIYTHLNYFTVHAKSSKNRKHLPIEIILTSRMVY